MNGLDSIIIIGAGVAGLAAAERLREVGANPLLLEASSRIGGRVLTDRANGVVEVGAEFVHGAKAATWDVIRKHGIRTRAYDVSEGSPRRFAFQGVLQPVDWPMAGRIEEFAAQGERYSGPDTSLVDWFRRLAPNDDPAALIARDRIARVEASDPADLSALAVARERQMNTAGWDNYRLPGGYGEVAAAMAEGARIRLDAPVSGIAWGSGGANVSLASGETIQARAVVVTPSLGVLQRGLIEFSPALPRRKAGAIQRLRMGPAAKLILWFRRAFWPPFSFLGADRQLPSWWRVAEATALVGFAGGPEAIKIAALGEAGAIEAGLNEVSDLFGVDARAEFVRGKLMAWQDEPYILGGYSYTPLGAGDARDELAEPLAPLYFAGEATSVNGHVGTVHGAIESGWRAAAEVIRNAR